jgi:hypothetical protein
MTDNIKINEIQLNNNYISIIKKLDKVDELEDILKKEKNVNKKSKILFKIADLLKEVLSEPFYNNYFTQNQLKIKKYQYIERSFQDSSHWISYSGDAYLKIIELKQPNYKKAINTFLSDIESDIYQGADATQEINNLKFVLKNNDLLSPTLLNKIETLEKKSQLNANGLSYMHEQTTKQTKKIID